MQAKIIESLNKRYSVKIFDSNKKISSENWNVIEEALSLTPSSFGLEPWQFLVITNPNLKQKLKSVSWNQSQIEDCSHLVVFCSKKNIDNAYITECLQNIANVRDIDVSNLSEYENVINNSIKTNPHHLMYTSNQTFIALGSILTVAAMLDIDACPIGGFHSSEYDKILNISPSYTSSVICAFGYRDKTDKYAKLKKVRKDKQDTIIKYN